MTYHFLKPKVILVGYSGHSLVAAEALMLSGHRIMGYLEKEESKENILQIDYLGFEQDRTVLERIKDILVFIAIGDNHVREKVTKFLNDKNIRVISAIHPNSNVSKQVIIGKGTLVARGANINPYCTIKNGVIINTGAIVEHGCIIYEYAHIAPGAVLAGNVKIGRFSFVGANAVIKQGITIGERVTIGAGAVVLRNIDNDMTFVGNPAKPISR